MYTKQHYDKIAEELKRSRPDPNDKKMLQQWRKDVDYLIGMFKRDNPSFVPERFREACYYHDE